MRDAPKGPANAGADRSATNDVRAVPKRKSPATLNVAGCRCEAKWPLFQSRRKTRQVGSTIYQGNLMALAKRTRARCRSYSSLTNLSLFAPKRERL